MRKKKKVKKKKKKQMLNNGREGIPALKPSHIMRVTDERNNITRYDAMQFFCLIIPSLPKSVKMNSIGTSSITCYILLRAWQVVFLSVHIEAYFFPKEINTYYFPTPSTPNLHFFYFGSGPLFFYSIILFLHQDNSFFFPFNSLVQFFSDQAFLYVLLR